MNKLMQVNRLLFIAAMAAALVVPQSGFATKHVVAFGGSLGMVYSPSSFSAVLGDTVVWNGSFVNHPLSSTTIPTGAASFHNGTGTTFSYTIKVIGLYNFRCDSHFTMGMIGSFNVTSTKVLGGMGNTAKNTPDAKMVMSGGHASIALSLQDNEFVTGSLFSLSGRRIETLVSQEFGPGDHSIPIANAGAGSYMIRLFVGGREQEMMAVVAR